MATPTTTYSLSKPTVGGDDNAWGTEINNNLDKLDDLLDGTLSITPNLATGWEVGGVAVTASAAELNLLDGVTASTAEINLLDGVTASTAEINILDGVTASTAEINLLDGVTATTAELNHVDGVTSNIQTQLNNKQPLDADLTAIAALTPASNRVILGNGTTWTTTELPSSGVVSVSASTPLASSGGATPTISLTGTVAVANGGTGSTTASGARTNLGAQATITGAASTITASNLTGSRTLVSNALGKVEASVITSSELAQLDGVTSNIQTQLNAKAANTVQMESTWEAGTSTTETIVSPAKVKAQITSTLNASGSAPVYACRAWVNFYGVGLVGIRASGNVSSITDNGTGDYRVNFATAMPDANYAIITSSGSFSSTVVSRQANSKSDQSTGPINKTTTHCEVLQGVTSTGALADHSDINVAIFR